VPRPWSRTIATLDREIGVALFVRTTRAVSLTDAGLDFLAPIESVLAEFDEAEHAARETGELRGILRIGLATTFAVRVVIELVRLLPEWDAGTVELNAVYPSGRAAKPSARAFVDHLIAALHKIERPPSSPPSIGKKPRTSA
jgi:DNA-binding transcriptional LysR family regulator